MTNQTERMIFEKCYRKLNGIPDGASMGWDGNRYFKSLTQYAWEQWQAATAYARQDERAKVIEECANTVINADIAVLAMMPFTQHKGYLAALIQALSKGE